MLIVPFDLLICCSSKVPVFCLISRLNLFLVTSRVSPLTTKFYKYLFRRNVYSVPPNEKLRTKKQTRARKCITHHLLRLLPVVTQRNKRNPSAQVFNHPTPTSFLNIIHMRQQQVLPHCIINRQHT